MRLSTELQTHRGQRSAISVVIPTRGNPESVERLLRSLAAAAEGSVYAEIFVVDDSDPREAERIRAHCSAFDARYVGGPRNVGAKRNLGASQAANEVVLFVDSDCVATPDLLAHHLAAHESLDQRFIGVAGTTLFHGKANFGAKVVERSMVYEMFSGPRIYDEMLWATTSNLSVRKHAFLEMGGFDEKPLTVVGGEDVDFGLRAARLGQAIRACAKAEVLHSRPDRAPLRGSARKLFRYGIADTWLCDRYPRSRRVCANPAILAPAAFALGAVIGRSRWLVAGILLSALTLLAVYLVEVRKRRERRADWRYSIADLFSVVFDWSYDLGVVCGGIITGKPWLCFTRFEYTPVGAFVSDIGSRDPDSSDAEAAGRR
ncbi:glycosyltransferase involved in cell wall biosynthesis [Catenulispora sp. GAS73]|uniref:glycosyltransferase family 2 protein n=1 Tax=Catenulispora sp. GAS73 TaxID=3156269 RepID=UPI0035196628